MDFPLELTGPGVYHLISDGEVVYVGGSSCLSRRIKQWMVSQDVCDFNRVEVFPVVNESEIAALEEAQIAQHMPDEQATPANGASQHL